VDARAAARDNEPSMSTLAPPRPVTNRILAQLQVALTSPDPIAALRALTALRAELDAYEREQVRRALEDGDSFTAIARGLGVSRQAAHRRYRHLVPERQPVSRVTPEVRGVLRLAREEAARCGAECIEGEHVVRALVAAGRLPGLTLEPARALPGSRPPTTLGRRLLSALTRMEPPIDVEDLLRAAAEEPAARRLLDRLP
jgi:hypothetical protein